jgi:hypothetical protein
MWESVYFTACIVNEYLDWAILFHFIYFEESLLGSTTIRFPEGPVTIKTLYEWYDNGVWVPRVVVSEASDAATATKTEQ